MGEFDPSVWFRLVERDRRLLVLLAEHRVLTTEQIAAVEFTSVRRAQDRLRILRELGMVFAFRDSFAAGGTSPNRHTLGYAGARLIAAQREQAPPTPAGHRLALERLAASPRLGHLLGVNQFFCDLTAYARHTRSEPSASTATETGSTHASRAQATEPTAPPPTPRGSESTGLTVWLPERLATLHYATCQDQPGSVARSS